MKRTKFVWFTFTKTLNKSQKLFNQKTTNEDFFMKMIIHFSYNRQNVKILKKEKQNLIQDLKIYSESIKSIYGV